MHDGQRGLQAALNVHFLQRSLVHVGIFLDGLDEIGDPRGTLFKLSGDAAHFKESAEPR